MKNILNYNTSTWTDHNPSDPGITLLEALHYVLSDLNYRAGFSVPDLLAERTAGTPSGLYSPREILYTRPASWTDLRAVLLDLPGIRNAWLQKRGESLAFNETLGVQAPSTYVTVKNALRFPTGNDKDVVASVGSEYVYIEQEQAEQKDMVNNRAWRAIQANRNLGEAFSPGCMVTLPVQEVFVSADVEIDPGAAPEQTLADICLHLERFIHSRPSFSRLSEAMANPGARAEDVFQGPPLESGFLDREALERYQLRAKLYGSDVIGEIMAVQGVRSVRRLEMAVRFRYPQDTIVEKKNTWELPLEHPELPDGESRRASVYNANGFRDIRLRVNGTPVGIDFRRMNGLWNAYRKPVRRVLPREEKDRILPPGRYRNAGRYSSVMHHLPEVYGVGEGGLKDSAPAQRKAQARQLQAYLLQYDQVLANTFAQMAHVGDLYGLANTPTYAPQSAVPTDVAEDLLRLQTLLAQSPEAYAAQVRTLTEVEQLADAEDPEMRPKMIARLERKNRILDHLLARFGESMQRYSALLPDIYPSPTAPDQVTAFQKLIADKLCFLQHYPAFSAHRGGALNCFSGTDPENISGFQRRVGAKLGMGILQLERISPLRLHTWYDWSGDKQFKMRWVLVEIETGKILLSDSQFPLKDQAVTLLEPGKTMLDLGGGKASTALLPKGGQRILGVSDLDSDTVYYTREYAQMRGVIDDFLEKYTPLQDTPENFYVVEHILLRPYRNTKMTLIDDLPLITRTPSRDPFSRQITVVLPDWPGRLQHQDFKELVERTLQEECPAHLILRTVWLDAASMGEFEERYFTWLDEMKYHYEQGYYQEEQYPLHLMASNRLIDFLGLGMSWPWHDLPVEPVNSTYYQDQRPVIRIKHTEIDVWYELFVQKETSEQLVSTGIKARSEGGTLLLEAPAVNEDVKLTYRVKAVKHFNGDTMERWIGRPALVWVGVNQKITLAVKEEPVDFDNPAVIYLEDSQKSVAYQFFQDVEKQHELIDGIKFGDGKRLELVTVSLQDDISKIYIHAFKVDDSGNPVGTDQDFLIPVDLQIKVRPNPRLGVSPVNTILDDLAKIKVQVANQQKDVVYRLGTLTLNNNEFSFTRPPSGNKLTSREIDNGAGGKVYVQIDRDLAQTPPALQPDLMSNGLTEDSLLVVLAEKSNDTRQFLSSRSVALVRPNPNVTILWPQTPIYKYQNNAYITLRGTQAGVRYQLFRVMPQGAETPWGEPGYHYADRVIETMRVEIDLVVGMPAGDPRKEDLLLLVPTTDTGTFAVKIYAIKTRTGVRVPLKIENGVYTIEISEPPT